MRDVNRVASARRLRQHLDIRNRPATPCADELLERDDDLAQLEAALDGLRGGVGSTVLIAGEAGSGKTALVRAFSSSIGKRAQVLSGACDPLSTPRPLAPFRDLDGTSDLFRHRESAGTSPSDVFGLLRSTSTEQPTVIVLEDLHWADEATLDVIRLLARRAETLPTVLVGSYRDGELGRGHPVRTLLGDIAAVRSLARIDLAPLSPRAVAELASGSDVDAEELHALTGGNPFFVTEILAGDGDAIPSSIRDAVLARLAALPSDAVELMELVSVVTPRADSWLIHRVLGDRNAALEACLQTGLVVIDRDGVRYRHELARRTVEGVLLPQRRMCLHREVLAALEAHPAAVSDAAQLAHHAEGAFDADAVRVHARCAAMQAAACGAYREAAAQYDRALRFANGEPDDRRAELLEGRSRACYLADDQIEAIEAIRRAITCRRRHGAANDEARALVELADYLSCRGLLAEAVEAIDRATALVHGQPESAAHARVTELRARTQCSVGNATAARELAQRAIVLGERFHDDDVTGHARVTLGSATMITDVARGAAILEASITWADDRNLHEVVARGLNAIGARAMWSGRRELAAAHLDRAIAQCTEHLQDLWRINALALAARNALDRGRWDDAIGYATAVLDDPRESPWPQHEAWLVVALVRTRRGDPGATAAVDHAEAVGVSVEEIGAHLDLVAARAEISWTERRISELDLVTTDAIAAAQRRGDAAAVARLSFWRRLGGLDVDGRFELDLDGLPYETALARLLDGDEASLRTSHDELGDLGARPAGRVVARALRSLGARGIERGPRPATRERPGGLTAREYDVLELLAEGLRNADIAERLVISRRTVDHHVSAILRKLDASTRSQAVARVGELGFATN